HHGNIEPRDLGVALVAQVGLAASSPQALSLLDLEHATCLASRIEALTAAVRQAYTARYRESQMRRFILEAFDRAAWAGVRQFLDIGDLCRMLASRVPDPHVRAAARAVLGELEMAEKIGRDGNGFDVFGTSGLVADHFSVLDVPLCGLSIYCPWPRASA